MADFTPQEIEQFLQQFFGTVGARQYVGARYVPIFGRAGEDSLEWDDLAPYEPLTVVMHQGVSYVSRRYVPAGIPLSDTAYWVETYRFNAQVEQYRQEVLGFQDQIDQLRDDLVPFPDPLSLPKYGTLGQVLTTLANGATRWEDPVVPSDAQAEAVITQWLDDHPEATTTVQDGSLTLAKFSTALKRELTINVGHITNANYAASLPDLNYAADNTLYLLSITSGSTQIPANLPHDTWDYGDSVGMLVCESALTWGLQTQLFVVADGAYRRVINTTTHTEQIAWKRLLANEYVSLMANYVNSANYATVLPDANGAGRNTIYALNLGNGATDIPANLPYTTWPVYNAVALLETVSTAGSWGLAMQRLTLHDEIWTRIINTETHTAVNDWAAVRNQSDYVALQTARVHAGNYATVLPDVNYAPRNSLYMLNFGVTSDIPANLPYTTWPTGNTAAMLETVSTSAAWAISMQRLTMRQEIWLRVINTDTHAVVHGWMLVAKYQPPERYDIYVSKGLAPANVYPADRMFDNLTEAVYYAAVTHEGEVDTIHVLDGEYDLVQEFTDKFGSLENFDSETAFNGFALGLRLGDFNVIGYGNNLIKFLYSGSNTFIRSKFSPFTNYWQADRRKPSTYRLEGLNIEVQNCQYCIHDELSARNYDYVTEQRHEFKNLTLKKSGTYGGAQAIGGGMGTNTRVIIDGCTFQTGGGVNADIVTYHNGLDESCQGFIEITNCYFVNGTFRLGYYGNSTLITTAICCGNSFTKVPYVAAQSASYTNVNMELKAWNNEIRS